MQRLKQRWDLGREVVAAPRARVELFGSNGARRVYESYTAPHPRFRVIPRKSWGVAMLPLPDSVEEYLAGKSRELLRRKRRRALSRGFEFRTFQATTHVEDVLAINRSATHRQGQPMHSSYTDEAEVRRFCENARELYGVFDGDGRLRAYTYAPELGDVGIFIRLLGHADDLEQGTMYLLVSEVVARLIADKSEQGHPAWASYDTFWGASPGLAHFKRRLGFRPYRVDWVWSGDR